MRARERGSEAIGEIEPGCRDCHVPRVCADPTLTAGAAGRAGRASPVTKDARQRQRHQAKAQSLPRRRREHAHGPNGAAARKKGSRQASVWWLRQGVGGFGGAMRGPVAAGWARPEDTKKKSTSQSLLKPRSIVSLSRGRSKPPPRSNLPPALRLDKRPHRHKQGRDSALKQPLRLPVCAATAQQRATGDAAGTMAAGQQGNRAAGRQYRTEDRATAIQGNTGRGSRAHTGCRGGADGRRGHQLMGTGAGSGLETRNVRYRLCSARLVGVVGVVGVGSGRG
jgi:hypothetical protein